MKLKDFLLSDKNMIVDEDTSQISRYAYGKMIDTDNDIIYIYKNFCDRNNIFNPFLMYTKALGMYSFNNNTFYFFSSFEKKCTPLDASDLNISTIDKLKLEIENKVNAMILEKIENDETKLNVNLDDIKLFSDEDIKAMAERKITSINCREVDINSYANFKLINKEHSLPVYIAYINDETLAILEECHGFIEENKDMIYREINCNKRLISCIQSLKENPEYDLIQKLNLIFDNEDYKTLNITYKKDGNEMIFKINNGSCLDSLNDTLDSCNIASVKDRNLFRNTFRDNEGYPTDIEPKYIEKITYGKNVLYQKNA